jgi:phosphate transport system substrate-binding protein
MNRRAQFWRGALAAAFAVGAGAAGAVEVRGAGAAFLAPVMDAWIAAYTEHHPEVTITYGAAGGGVGVARFLAGEVHFGGSDALLEDAEAEAVDGELTVVPATASTVAVAYNLPDVGTGLELSREVLAGIFLGEITDWQDPRTAALNPEADLPGLTITLVARRDPAGTTAAFTRHLSAISPAWRASFGESRLVEWPGLAMSASGEAGVAELIAESWGAVGYVERGHAANAGLGIAHLENAAGNYVAPGPQTGRAALAAVADEPRPLVADPDAPDAYPIVDLGWLLLRPHHPRPGVHATVHDFAAWALSEGQAIAAELGYVPLPAAVTEPARRRLAQPR